MQPQRIVIETETETDFTIERSNKWQITDHFSGPNGAIGLLCV